jgi:hypothetical protein
VTNPTLEIEWVNRYASRVWVVTYSQLPKFEIILPTKYLRNWGYFSTRHAAVFELCARPNPSNATTAWVIWTVPQPIALAFSSVARVNEWPPARPSRLSPARRPDKATCAATAGRYVACVPKAKVAIQRK